jgi:hypothetical protein
LTSLLQRQSSLWFKTCFYYFSFSCSTLLSTAKATLLPSPISPHTAIYVPARRSHVSNGNTHQTPFNIPLRQPLAATQKVRLRTIVSAALISSTPVQHGCPHVYQACAVATPTMLPAQRRYISPIVRKLDMSQRRRRQRQH